jgi:hypothetical protein
MHNVEDLRALTATPTRCFAYPFGGPFTTATAALLREAGIVVACTVGETPATPDMDPMTWPRLEVRNWTGDEFRRRLETWFNPR